MNSAIYTSAVGMFASRSLDWENDTIKVLLATDRYEPDQTRHSTRSDLRLAEVVPSGTYRSGGSVLNGRSITQGLNEILLTGGSVEWSGFTGEFRYAVVYQSDTDALIAYTDLGTQTTESARLSLSFEDGVCAFEIVPPSFSTNGKGELP